MSSILQEVSSILHIVVINPHKYQFKEAIAQVSSILQEVSSILHIVVIEPHKYQCVIGLPRCLVYYRKYLVYYI